MAPVPGHRLLRFASRWFDAATVSHVFEPLVADWQREWRDTPAQHRASIWWRGWCGFIVAALAVAPSVLLFTPVPPSMARRVLARMIIFTSAISLLLTIPFVVDVQGVTLDRLVVLTLLLTPSGAALAFPFAMTWVTDAVRRGPCVTANDRIAAIRVAMVGSLVAFVLIGWIVPAANQQFRELAAPEWVRRPVTRGVHELTTVELFVVPGRAVVDRRIYKEREAAIEQEIHQRAVLSLLPAVLVWLRCAALSRPRRGRLTPLPPAIATIATVLVFFPLYFLSVNIEPVLGIRTGTALWLPLAGLVAWAILEGRRSSARAEMLTS